jgi:hypothetical protein
VFAAVTGEDAMVFNVVAALIVAFIFAPLRERLQRGLDRLFGRDPAALRSALDQAGRELLGALDPTQVRASVEAAITRGLRAGALEWPGARPPRLADPRADPRGRVQRGREPAAPGRDPAREPVAPGAARGRRAPRRRAARGRDPRRAARAPRPGPAAFPVQRAERALLSHRDRPAAAQRFTERLADMLRYTVEASARPGALLSEEIAFVEDYLGVARERYENALAFEYCGPRELLSLPVPPLLLQPLVENSLKHGGVPADERSI